MADSIPEDSIPATRKKKKLKQKNTKPKEEKPILDSSGIDSINNKILKFYPDQKNHIQATALTKYWNGGPDPLDYISILLHSGNEEKNIPQHWHYISFGLSDLHGDGRVHEATGPTKQSGYGFELTFRLKRQAGEINPPMWPTKLMNTLARYIFQTGNFLNYGDHIPWNSALDGSETSLIQHMVIADDVEFQNLQTNFGKFDFRQIVGLTHEEVKYVQQWKGSALISLMRENPGTGGRLLITDNLRENSVFDISPKSKKMFFESIERDGSNLGHVMTICSWEDDNTHNIERSDIEKQLTSVTLKFDLEAASLLPLVMRLRLKKNKYFIYQNIAGQVIIFMPPEFDSEMVTVSEQHPIKVDGKTLQIYCSNELITAMSTDLSLLENTAYLQDKLPIKFEINSPPLTIMVLTESQIQHKT